jgi:ATP-dependent exoDNAse (exonuclease V) beta subunit
MTFYDNDSKQVRRVAGETDMIAVDKEGRYHIIDFKTSLWSYADQIDNRTKSIFNSLDSPKPRALNDSRF